MPNAAVPLPARNRSERDKQVVAIELVNRETLLRFLTIGMNYEAIRVCDFSRADVSV